MPPPIGAVSETELVAVRTVSTPRSDEPPPVEALAVRVGSKRVDGRHREAAEENAEHPAGGALSERLAGDLPDDQALRPTEGLQRAELTDALPDRGDGEQRREQERGRCRDDREDEPEVVREIRRRRRASR